MSGHFNYLELEKKYHKILAENAIMREELRGLRELNNGLNFTCESYEKEIHELKEKLLEDKQ